jgi:hypothetical protein
MVVRSAAWQLDVGRRSGPVVSPEPLSIEDLDGVLIWVRREGFPVHLDDEALSSARRILRDQPDFRAVLVDAGASTYYRVDVDQVDEVTLAAARGGGGRGPGYEMPGEDAGVGMGDGATLAGYPVSWSLITLTCGKGCTVLLTRYPRQLPRCPRHGLPLQIMER